MPEIPNPAYLAVTEAISFYRYHQHNEILSLLEQPQIPWESLVPAPSVPLHEAETHVDKVREACGIAEDGSDIDDGPSEDLGEQATRVLNELKQMQERTGQASLMVEVDGYPYKLVLSDLNTLTFEQRSSLASYTRCTNIIQRLTDHVKHLDLYIPAPTPPPAPSPTTVLPPTAQPTPAPAQTTLRLAVRLIPRFVSAAIKVEIALWMITRGLQYSDWRYLAFTSAGFLWWAWECTGMLRTEQRREAQRTGGPLPGQENAQGNVENVLVRGPGPGGLPDPGRRSNAASRRRRGPNPIPLFGLAYERRCLRLFYHDPASTRPITSATDHRIPHSERNLPLAPREPGFLWTYLVMPLYLLALSFWPDGDNARRAAIREREVHMRLLSQKLTEASQQSQTTETDEADPMIPPEQTSTPATATAAPNPVMPKNLGPKALQYWRRVLSRGETIDWEEERAAQAELLGRAGRDAGGVPEEEPMGLF